MNYEQLTDCSEAEIEAAVLVPRHRRGQAEEAGALLEVRGRGGGGAGQQAADRLLLLPPGGPGTQARVAALAAAPAVPERLLDSQQTLLALVVDYRQPGSKELIKLNIELI